jgi:SAM-dependent methyltransferase
MECLGGFDMSYTLVRCHQCGFHFAHKLPDEKQYLSYYELLSKYDSQPSVSSLDRQRIDAAVDFCTAYGIVKESRIVDLGCGFGGLLAALKDSGWTQLLGIDPAPQSSYQARKQFGLERVYQGTLSQVGDIIDISQADLVCLMAVLEHLPLLRRDLAGILHKLRVGARLLIEVPALELFDGNRGEPLGELSIEHIQYFSVQSLSNLLGCFDVNILAHKILALPDISSGSLFVLAEKGGAQKKIIQEDSSYMDAYLQRSLDRMKQVLRCVPDHPFVLYGAGSHSARLIPMLSQHQRANIVAVFDGNINLQGKSFGDRVVMSPSDLVHYRHLPVVISSYRSAMTITANLKQKFPDITCKLLYQYV